MARQLDKTPADKLKDVEQVLNDGVGLLVKDKDFVWCLPSDRPPRGPFYHREEVSPWPQWHSVPPRF
jgi:hypothetical protein